MHLEADNATNVGITHSEIYDQNYSEYCLLVFGLRA
jgi:hypothetical protein